MTSQNIDLFSWNTLNIMKILIFSLKHSDYNTYSLIQEPG
jgi:hypothetical protein